MYASIGLISLFPTLKWKVMLSVWCVFAKHCEHPCIIVEAELKLFLQEDSKSHLEIESTSKVKMINQQLINRNSLKVINYQGFIK